MNKKARAGLFSKVAYNKRVYLQKKKLGICKSCPKEAIKGLTYCLEHQKKAIIRKKIYRERMKKLKFIKPNKEGFSEIKIRCHRCKVFFLQKDGHICPEDF